MAERKLKLVRMISTRFVTAWLVGMFATVCAQTPPVQVGDMSCILDSTTGIMKAKMAIYKKTAPVSRAYFTQLHEYHIEYTDTGCQWTGTGTDTDPFLAEVEIDSRTNLPPFGQNGCGYQIVDPVAQVYKWTAYNQRQDEHGRDGDVVFVFECSGKGTPTSISVQVTFDGRDNEGVAERVKPENRLSILEQPTGSSSFVQVVTDDISVGQLIKLRIETKVKTTRQIGIDHYGVYGFYCDWRLTASGPSTRFIEMNGCGNSVFNQLLGTGFRYSRFQTVSSTERWFQTETNSFILVPSVPANNYYYIQCFVGYCYGTDGADSRCTDYCGTNARSRRSLSNVTEFDSVSVKVKVKDEQYSETVNVQQTVEEETIVEKETGLASHTIIIIIATVLGFLLSAVIVAVAVVCCCRRRRHGAEREWSDTSTTDSRKNLSSYASAYQHRYPKY